MSRTRLALAALAVVLALLHIRYLWFVCDDAFITFRYAANFAGGLGPVFNPGERVEGYTNFLWMLLSAGVVRAGGAPEVVMPMVSAGCALATVAAVWLLGNPWAGLLLACSAGFAAWATSGLETALFTMLVTLGYLACVRGRTVWAGLAMGLASLTRPEGALVGVCAFGYLVWRGSSSGVSGTPRGKVRGAGLSRDPALGISRRAALAGAAVWAAFVVAHLAWRVSYYGEWLPNTFAIKTPGLAALASGAQYLRDAILRAGLVPLLAIAALLVGRRRVQRPYLGMLTAIAVPYMVYVASTGGDFMPQFRYMAPLLPILAIAAGFELQNLKRIVVAGLLAVGFGTVNAYDSYREQSSWTRGHLESVGLTRENAANWARVGARLKKLSLPSDTLAITAAGVIPYVTGLHTIDLLGLTSPDLSRYRRRATMRPGHAFYLSGAALAERPPQFLFGHPEVRPSFEGLGLGLDFEPEWRDRVLQPYELLGYRLWGEPRAFVVIAVRHDAVLRVEEAGRSGP